MAETNDTNQAMALLRVIDRFLTVVYIPITIWTVMQVFTLREWRSSVDSSRYTIRDGYELSRLVDNGLTALQGTVISLQRQHDDLERRVLRLEEGR